VDSHAYARLEQPFPLAMPGTLRFDYGGLEMPCSSLAGILERGATMVLEAYCEADRIVVYVPGQQLIYVDGAFPTSGSLRIELTRTEVITYSNETEMARASVPEGADLQASSV